MSLGSKIREQRNNKKMSLKNLSDITKISVVDICNIENGNVRMPQICNLIKLANALDLDLKYLLSEEKENAN